MIPFTQFLRPDGRLRPVAVARPADIDALAQALSGAGCEFRCEVLTTGQVSLTVSNGQDDIAIEICDNDPSVPGAVDRFVRAAHKEVFG